jgi:uncharacterized protein YndB with AHSA1/START domain
VSNVVATVDIDASPQEVWDVVMDPRRTAEWVTIHRHLGHHDDGSPRPGYEMEQTLCLRGVNFKVHWTLAEADAPRFAVWEGRGPARSRARIVERLTEIDGGRTRFHYENEFKAPLGPFGAVASRALVAGLPRREADASLQLLKQILEQDRG